MNNKQAKHILLEMKLEEFSKHEINVLCGINGMYLYARNPEVATLDGEFTADQLEAIAAWMRDSNGVVDA